MRSRAIKWTKGPPLPGRAPHVLHFRPGSLPACAADSPLRRLRLPSRGRRGSEPRHPALPRLDRLASFVARQLVSAGTGAEQHPGDRRGGARAVAGGSAESIGRTDRTRRRSTAVTPPSLRGVRPSARIAAAGYRASDRAAMWLRCALRHEPAGGLAFLLRPRLTAPPNARTAARPIVAHCESVGTPVTTAPR